MSDADCIFCKIASGKLSAYIVYEDTDVLAFLDSHPLFPGHVLLCPREHFVTLSDLPSDLIGPVFSRAQLLSKAVSRLWMPKGRLLPSTTASARLLLICTSMLFRAAAAMGCGGFSGRARTMSMTTPAKPSAMP